MHAGPGIQTRLPEPRRDEPVHVRRGIEEDPGTFGEPQQCGPLGRIPTAGHHGASFPPRKGPGHRNDTDFKRARLKPRDGFDRDEDAHRDVGTGAALGQTRAMWAAGWD